MNHPPPILPESEASNRNIVLIAYILGGIGVLTAALPTLAALVLCYVKRNESTGTIYRSHFDWLISTFWIGCAGAVLAFATFLIGIGIFIYIAVCVWLIYRFVKGLLRFSERKAVV